MDAPGRARAAIRGAVDGSGRTRAELARELGVAESTLYAWLSGRSEPSFGDLERLAAATGQALVLRFGEGEEQAPSPLGAWGDNLAARIAELEAGVQRLIAIAPATVDEDLLAASRLLVERLEGTPPPSDAESPAARGRRGQDG